MTKSGLKHKIRKAPLLKSIICSCLLLILTFGLSFPASVRAQEYLPPEQMILTWTADPATTQAITWLMPSSSSAWVQYIQAGDYSGSFAAAHQLEVRGTIFDGSGTLYRFSANLTGLAPGTKYIYRVGREGSWSEPSAFTTASAADSFTFLYMGDIQSGYTGWGNMLDLAYETCPQIKFALLGGDLTDKGHDEEEWREFLGAAAGVFSRIPVLPALGNHDGSMYLNFFALPQNGPAGLEQEFYSFDYGGAHFVILDSNNNTSAAARRWLQRDLEATDKKWKFAMFHHPAYPAVFDYKGIDQSIRENWVPILEQNGVDLVFVGHQHLYMRTHPIYQGEVRHDAYGIVYVMGNAGSKIYSGGGGFPYIACEKTGSNYQVINLNSNVLTLTSKEANGELLESYTIRKSPSGQPERPLYKVIPQQDPLYGVGITAEGLKTMIVNPGQTGFKYFTVFIEPFVANEGEETIVFTQSRDALQLQLNALTADFDLVEAAQAGFNVGEGDVIKVFIVDHLNNAVDFNPTILQ